MYFQGSEGSHTGQGKRVSELESMWKRMARGRGAAEGGQCVKLDGLLRGEGEGPKRLKMRRNKTETDII